MGFTCEHLRRAAAAIADKAEAAAEELNGQDAKLGDGDLGITVSKGWREVANDAAELPEDLGQAFLACAKAFQRVSSSSFGTLVATALMSAAKATKGRREAEWHEVSGLLASARDAMIARGRGSLGDKSLLDAVDAVAAATQGLDSPTEILAAADRATGEALDSFRDRPNKLGRARMFGEKSIGLDDPGMLAFRRLLDGLTRPDD
ncbi:MAG: dihydroxyacetone kinase subunit L [Kiloniellales bacterium]|nr:dihydroxyacetone kinase subunit L [Kiloniellales bacterium]